LLVADLAAASLEDAVGKISSWRVSFLPLLDPMEVSRGWT
jgi:hypothetical protein